MKACPYHQLVMCPFTNGISTDLLWLHLKPNFNRLKDSGMHGLIVTVVPSSLPSALLCLKNKILFA